ncbi:unnamed protein product [Lactuca saligna]|uniref:peroxidase n=1 Tax=Lactuca saligna TaxID=75948 RepID=A0AA35Y1V9_LACSI|nr:unnamed protein product [Lactuca saligna]
MTGRLRHVVLGIIIKLVSSLTTEEQEFYLLNIVIQSYGYDVVAVLLFLVLSKYDFSVHCLKCFEHLDIIKAEFENECPGVVSCVDLLVVAIYESVILAGGPFYPAHTGRKDSNRSFSQLSYELVYGHFMAFCSLFVQSIRFQVAKRTSETGQISSSMEVELVLKEKKVGKLGEMKNCLIFEKGLWR